MKHLIHIIIAFLLGVGVGAYYGRTTVKEKAISVATQAYEQGLSAVVASGSAELSTQGENLINDLKEQGKEEMKKALKEQINNIFN